MSDGQEMAPEEQILHAADAFKTFLNPEAPRQRDEAGRFAAQEQEIEVEAEEQSEEEAESGAQAEGETEALEEGQPELPPMPASWSKDDTELWSALPPEVAAKVAEREGQRDNAVQLKFQEAARDRQAAAVQLSEANANRDRYASEIDHVLSMVSPEKPDPRHFGAGTAEYDRESYDLAVFQYDQAHEIVKGLRQQRETITAQQHHEAEAAEKSAYDDIERTSRPMLLSAVPDIADPAKAGPALASIVDYAVKQGIPPEVFTGDNAKRITSAELLMAWKAKQYDEGKAASQRIKETVKPQAKPAPTLKPGGITSRSAIQGGKFKADMSRLAKTGSVEDGAAIWKHFAKG